MAMAQTQTEPEAAPSHSSRLPPILGLVLMIAGGGASFAALYLGLLPLVAPAALPLLLLLPLAVQLFRRTLRELTVALAGVLLPLFVLCYINWGVGGDFAAPLLEAAKDLGASKLQTFVRIIIPLTMPGIIAGCLLVMLPAMGLFYVSDLMGGAKNLLIGNVIKSQFLNIRDWPFGSATSITLTVVMGLMLLVYWRASRLLNKKVELE